MGRARAAQDRCSRDRPQLACYSAVYVTLQVAMDIADAFKLPASKVVHVKVCITFAIWTCTKGVMQDNACLRW